MDSESQINLISGADAPAWIRDHDPLRGALEEMGENSRFLFHYDADWLSSAEQVVRELDALIEILIWADDHHPSGKVYTTFPLALAREELSLIRRLAGAALDCLGCERAPFAGDWQMIIARWNN